MGTARPLGLGVTRYWTDGQGRYVVRSGIVRFAQSVPAITSRSPRVRPIAWVGTKTHFARVGWAAQSAVADRAPPRALAATRRWAKPVRLLAA